MKPCTNNEAEYEALIAGLEIALDMGVRCKKVYGDSLLLVHQVQGIDKALAAEFYRVRRNGVVPVVTGFPLPRRTFPFLLCTSITFERIIVPLYAIVINYMNEPRSSCPPLLPLGFQVEVEKEIYQVEK